MAEIFFGNPCRRAKGVIIGKTFSRVPTFCGLSSGISSGIPICVFCLNHVLHWATKGIYNIFRKKLRNRSLPQTAKKRKGTTEPEPKKSLGQVFLFLYLALLSFPSVFPDEFLDFA